MPLIIAGKSLGGLIATLIAADPEKLSIFKCKPMGVISLGYPFHSIIDPKRTRYEHFRDITIPHLLIQGEFSQFGSEKEME